jgi:hypothetical protein
VKISGQNTPNAMSANGIDHNNTRPIHRIRTSRSAAQPVTTAVSQQSPYVQRIDLDANRLLIMPGAEHADRPA